MAASKEAGRGLEERSFKLRAFLSVSDETLRVCGGPVNFMRLGSGELNDLTRGGMEDNTFLSTGTLLVCWLKGSCIASWRALSQMFCRFLVPQD